MTEYANGRWHRTQLAQKLRATQPAALSAAPRCAAVTITIARNAAAPTMPMADVSCLAEVHQPSRRRYPSRPNGSSGRVPPRMLVRPDPRPKQIANSAAPGPQGHDHRLVDADIDGTFAGEDRLRQYRRLEPPISDVLCLDRCEIPWELPQPRRDLALFQCMAAEIEIHRRTDRRQAVLCGGNGVALSFKQYQPIFGLFVQPDGTLPDIAHRETTKISVSLIREMILEYLKDPDLIDLLQRVLSLEPMAGYLLEDAAGIVEKWVVRAVRNSKQSKTDVDNAIQKEVFPVIAAIVVDVAGADPNTIDLPEGVLADDFRTSMRSYLAAKKRWEDRDELGYLSPQMQEELSQIKATKREIASQRRALAQLLGEADIQIKNRLADVDRRSRDIEHSFTTYRDLLRDDFAHLQNAASSDDLAREKRLLEFLDGTQTELSKVTTEVVDVYKAEIEKLNANRTDADNRFRESLGSVRDYISRADAAEARLDALNASLSLTDENLAAFKKAAEERAGQSQSRQHWSRRVMINSVGFGLSLALILFFLIVVPVLGFVYSPDILLFLKSVNSEINSELGTSPNAAQVTMAAVNRLLLVGAPVALYFWLVRILVRYNSMALALMDDAHQRRTMIDTYIHLIEHQVARTEDRAILLNAIFRASPGQGNDVEPPSFVDLIDRLKPST